MKLRLLAVLFACVCAQAQEPQYTKEGLLVRPANYREWIFLSSGLGMTYGPVAEGATADNPFFDNVFVTPRAYKSFLETGKWPDKTMLVLEVRSSVGKGSINNGGHYQGESARMETLVKDESRFPGKWGFFAFGESTEPVKQVPTNATCYACHSANAAVEYTFVQFYPTLLEVARAKGTLKKTGEK
jgi:cytochrome P460